MTHAGLTTMHLLGRLEDMPLEEIATFVRDCRRSDGGYGGAEGHDSHLLYTLSAVQILALLDRLDDVDADAVASYVAGLQQEDGSFAGDCWGEIDSRFRCP